MKLSFIFIAMMAYCTLAYSQSNDTDVANKECTSDTLKTKQDNSKKYEVVEQMPSFPGGINALMNYLNKNMKYPRAAENAGIQGRVVAQFIVDKDGSITNVKVVKSVHPLLDAEAVRVVESMPKWIPGMNKGEAISVRYTIPLTFKFQESNKGKKKKNGHHNFDTDEFFQ